MPTQPVRVAEIRDEWVKVELLEQFRLQRRRQRAARSDRYRMAAASRFERRTLDLVFIARLLTERWRGADARGGWIHGQVGLGLRGTDRRARLRSPP